MDKKKTITVFTPAYNRAYCLHQLYDSLVRQTNQDFSWLIIDDGSIDNTEELVNSWINENQIEIRYVHKENGGMHTGHNLAYQLIDTELNVCIDSDDFMPDNAIELILDKWNSIRDKESVSGIVALDAYKDGTVIGTYLPDGISRGSYFDLYRKNKVKGDKKFILRTEILKEYPLYPEYKNEKLVPLGILYIMMGEKRPFCVLNEVVCIVEYQTDGSSNTIFKQYKQSPRGFAYARNIGKQYSKSLLSNIKNSIHLISSAIFANDFSLLRNGPKIIYNYLLFPFGVLLNCYIKYKIKKQ